LRIVYCDAGFCILILDFVPYLVRNEGITYNAAIMADSYRNILIVKPSSLGDIVMALPALRAVALSFPQAKISWLVRPEFAGLLQNHPFITDVIAFDRKFLGKAWYNPRAFSALISLIGLLRARKFDLVIDLQGLFRTACLGWLSGCAKRIGTSTAREFATLFYTHKVKFEADCIHVVDYYLKVARFAGAEDVGVEFILPEDGAAEKSVMEMLAGYGIDRDNYAVLIAGSVHQDKCWLTERFAALADKLNSEFNLPTVATGTVGEKAIVDKLGELANVPIVNLAGLTDLRQLTALLRKSRLVVSNDTGPGHIAAALDVPLVMIFGRANPARLAPYGRKDCVAAIDPYNRPMERNNTEPQYSVNAVGFEDVYEKVCRQLGGKIS